MTTTDTSEKAVVDDLTFSYPECPVCDTETATDGTSYWCEGCGSTWDHEGRNGSIEAGVTVAFTRCPSCGLNTGRGQHPRVYCEDRWHITDEEFWIANPHAVISYPADPSVSGASVEEKKA